MYCACFLNVLDNAGMAYRAPINARVGARGPAAGGILSRYSLGQQKAAIYQVKNRRDKYLLYHHHSTDCPLMYHFVMGNIICVYSGESMREGVRNLIAYGAGGEMKCPKHHM